MLELTIQRFESESKSRDEREDRLLKDLDRMAADLVSIRETLAKDFVRLDSIAPMVKFAYLIAATVMVGVVGGIMSLVIKQGPGT